MPMDIRMSPIADDPSSPLDSPFSQLRNFQAASCWAGCACSLTTVSQEYDTPVGSLPDGPTGIGATPTSSKRSPIASLKEPFHQFAMMIMAVLPLTKLSRYGPVVFALAVLISGTVEPSATRSAYNCVVSRTGPASSCAVFPSSNCPPLDATSDSHGWTLPAGQLVITPKPCCPFSGSVSGSAVSRSSSQGVGGASIPASSNNALL